MASKRRNSFKVILAQSGPGGPQFYREKLTKDGGEILFESLEQALGDARRENRSLEQMGAYECRVMRTRVLDREQRICSERGWSDSSIDISSGWV